MGEFGVWCLGFHTLLFTLYALLILSIFPLFKYLLITTIVRVALCHKWVFSNYICFVQLSVSQLKGDQANFFFLWKIFSSKLDSESCLRMLETWIQVWQCLLLCIARFRCEKFVLTKIKQPNATFKKLKKKKFARSPFIYMKWWK